MTEPRSGGRIGIDPLTLYALPMVGVNFSLVLLLSYITKYSVDVLFIAPAAIGAILGAGRIWDAITDPMAGYWSDRTRSPMGRRRPWLIASALPIAAFSVMAWSPPQGLEGTWLLVWMAVAIFGFSAAVTVFLVPHQALGAELSADYHQRTGIFARRQQFGVVGMMLALVGGISLLSTAEDPRRVAWLVSLAAAGVCILTIVPCSLKLRERLDYRDRGGRSGAGTVRDVLRNPHARRLYSMIFVEHMGAGTSMVLSPFLMAYVLGMPEMTGLIFVPYTGVQLLSIPLWSRLSGQIGKKATWLWAMGLGVLGYATIFGVGEGDLWLMFLAVSLTGASSAGGTVMGSSILADVVDYDEAETGERKEGAYYSLYNFLYKGSGGVMAMIAGAALQAVGFVPNQEQTPETLFTISALMSFVPIVCIVVGALIFTRFRLTEAEHAAIRHELDPS